MTLINGTNAGMFANICDVLRHIYNCQGGKYHIHWGKDTLYYDKTVGENAWEYFFVQRYEELSLPGKPVSGYTELPVKGQAFRELFHNLAHGHLTLNDQSYELLQKAQTGAEVGKDTLGIHVRHTDKFNWEVYGEPRAAAPIAAIEYVHAANRAMEKFKFRNIFLATDSREVTELFTKVFGSKVSLLNTPRSVGDEPVHSGMRNVPGYHKGIGVILDSWLLAECGYLIRSTSNVSSFAQFLNLELEHLNLNEVRKGDSREVEFGLTSSNYEGLL